MPFFNPTNFLSIHRQNKVIENGLKIGLVGLKPKNLFFSLYIFFRKITGVFVQNAPTLREERDSYNF